MLDSCIWILPIRILIWVSASAAAPPCPVKMDCARLYTNTYFLKSEKGFMWLSAMVKAQSWEKRVSFRAYLHRHRNYSYLANIQVVKICFFSLEMSQTLFGLQKLHDTATSWNGLQLEGERWLCYRQVFLQGRKKKLYLIKN